MKKRAGYFVLILAVIVASAAIAFAQTPSSSPTPAPPASDIFVIEVANHNGQLKFSGPKKITASAGYNNQPSFLADGKSVLYASVRDKQADIYRYDIGSGTTTQITSTPESEFSPTLMPDGKSISVVRVEADGTQRLWKFPLKGGAPQLILEKIKPVGYHLWIDDHTLALFKKHDMTNVGYFKPQDAPLKQNTLIYILAHPSREAAAKNWQAFHDDPEWQKVKAASETEGPLTTKIESVFADPTDYSPMK